MALIQSQRSYSNKETGQIFTLYTDSDKHTHHLIDSKGNEAKPFYVCAFDSVQIKINNSKIISLSMGEFYHLKEGEKATHKKYAGFKKFSKI